MRVVDQWRSIRSELPEEWGETKLNVAIARDEQRARAAALLGPAGPGRLGNHLRLSVHRAGGGIGPDQADKLFGKLDDEQIRATLSLVTVDEREAREQAPREPVAAQWEVALERLPADWSDLLCELQLTSTDHLAPGGPADGAAQSDPRAGPRGFPLPGRAPVRLRRVAGDDAALPRTPRRRGDPRQTDAPARSL